MDHEKRKIKRKNPRENANPLSVMTFGYTLPTLFEGWKKELQISDVYETLTEHKSNILGDRLEFKWLKELEDAKKDGRKPSLRRALIKTFGLEFFFYGVIFSLSELCFKVSQPILLGQLVAYYLNDYNLPPNGLYWYAAGVVGCSLMGVLIKHPYLMAAEHLGMKMRIACCSLIYRKTLKLTYSSIRQKTPGQTINLLSNDVNRFDFGITYAHDLWVGPLQTFVITYFMYEEMGISAIFGIFILLLFIPLQLLLGKKSATFRMQTALRTDERIHLMNEIISGIQVIKMYTWEKSFAKLVALARRYEIKSLRRTSYVRACLLSFSTFTTRLSLFFTVLAYVLLGSKIDAKKIFAVIGFYNVLRQSMTILFPFAISKVAELNVSINRLNQFLLHEETQLWKQHNNRSTYGSINENDFNLKCTQKNAVYMQCGTAKWSDSSTVNTFTNLNIRIKSGSLVSVIGSIGSGKTSLLHAILRELPLLQGTLEINGIVSYASQEPWIFSGNVRQNIIFGQPLNPNRYGAVVKKCCLERDFSLFPHGDRTLVGERGVSLSGGQRARINLARAIYKEADIYLLDDPLSAVDAHVSKELFEKCIKGFLRNKTVILITHQLQYLKDVDHVIVLKNGKIKTQGSFQELQESGLNFAKLLKQDLQDADNVDHFSLKSSVIASVRSQDEPRQVEEQRSFGSVSRFVYTSYFKLGANTICIILLVLMFLLAQVFGSFVDYFLGYWTNLEQLLNDKVYYNPKVIQSNYANNITVYVSDNIGKNMVLDTNTILFFSRINCIYIYTGIVFALIIVTLIRSFSFFTLCINASTRLHDNMFISVIHATMTFFNTNSSGRILNRFSKDIGSVDELLPNAIIQTAQIGLSVLGTVIVVIVANYWLIIPTLLSLFMYYGLQKFYLTSSRSIKRLEGIARSPVFAYINASTQGLTTIRAYGAQSILQKEFDNHQDLHSTVWYLFLSTSTAFGFWLDLICVIYIGFITISFLTVLDNTFAGNIGLALTQAINLTSTLQWGTRQFAEMENQMISLERVLEYNDIEHERELPDKTPPESWPNKGEIIFSNLCLWHSSQDPLILKDLNFTIKSNEKIGIVGRTGAGKSSIIAALFQLTKTEGSIIIDGIDIKTLKLQDLRSKISIIPQEPVLFSGTIRNNIDPFDEYDDEVLWKALEEVELKEMVGGLVASLDSVMSEGGSNFSVGQRQLVCLARAIIRNNKILILDEATANVDPQTDALIQKTIRRKFVNCTVLTIAHRLHTVMDSDKIMVMDNGRLLEFDHPYVLLQNKNSVFYNLVQQSGNSMAGLLRNTAEENFKRLHAVN
ncbi:hypothetical protein FQR65_LT13743 [Abscondita terminalis]|nr:hypothetical protein FQR65_LT13743 [Abscondita terminalis]